MSKSLYLVNFWEPFPSSEYGGLFAVVAESKAECIKLLKMKNEYDHLIPQAVDRAKVLELKDSSQASRIIESFTT
jgi:hypothetical protein